MTGHRSERPMRPGWRRVGAAAGVLACLMMSAVLPSSASGAGTPPPSCTTPTGTGACVLNTVTDAHGSPAGGPQTFPMQANISQTANLQPQQNVTISWSGFEPTHDYTFSQTASPYQYYELPVAVMQCWGTDTVAAPMDPTHCYAGTPTMRAGYYNDTNDPGDPAKGGVPNPPARNIAGNRYLGFTDVKGKHWLMAGYVNTPTDLQVAGAAFHPNFQYAWSDPSGSQPNIQFQVGDAQQYPSLGCSVTSACSIVIVPIMHPTYCAPTAAPDCSGPPKTPVGPTVAQADTGHINPYLTYNDWWMGSNWAHRMSFPISFAQQPNDCTRTDAAVPVTGSELAYPAMYSWAPDFCLDPKKFNLGYVSQSEPLARQGMTSGGPGQLNAALTSLPVTGSARPIVHAPVAVTGFTVSFFIDDKNTRQLTTLNLTPLLLAKLITDSYRGAQTSEPALQGNPKTLFDDPEFAAVNPNFVIPDPTVNWMSELNMVMLGGGDQSDVIWAMTSYINADPEARAWLDGAPDGYSGMVVNPYYRGYALPQLATEIRDTYKEPATNNNVGPCEASLPTPNQLVLSQPVNTLRDAALTELAARPQGLFNCVGSVGAPYTWVKGAPQVVGARALLALTSVPFASLYGLPTASLQVHRLANGQRYFAPPTVNSMTSAMAYAVQDKATGVLSLDYPHLAINAYPGTMPVYAVIPTAGLDATTAKDYAQFLTFAATDGQIVGTAIGQLPGGYAPLTGALQPLADYTLQVARDVAAQDGQVPAPPPNIGATIGGALGVSGPFTGALAGGGGGGSGGLLPGGGGGGTPGSGAGPTSGAPGAGSGKPPAGPGAAKPTTVALTRGVGSWLATWGLPILLVLGVVAGAIVPVVRVAAQPGHPVRIAVAGFGTRLAALVPRRAR